MTIQHADYPHSVCAHPELAAGNPCQVPYEQLTVKL
jgi:hypothetical protein